MTTAAPEVVTRAPATPADKLPALPLVPVRVTVPELPATNEPPLLNVMPWLY